MRLRKLRLATVLLVAAVLAVSVAVAVVRVMRDDHHDDHHHSRNFHILSVVRVGVVPPAPD